MTLVELAGIAPAVIFPAATLLQLVHLVRTKRSDGISVVAWSAFSVGNLCLYIYTEKYAQLQAIIGLLLTSFIQVFIVFLVIHYRRNPPERIPGNN